MGLRTLQPRHQCFAFHYIVSPTISHHKKSSPRNYRTTMKLPLAILLYFVHGIHGVVAALTMQPSNADLNPLVACKADSIIHDKVTALLANHGALMIPGRQQQQQTERSLKSSTYTRKYEKYVYIIHMVSIVVSVCFFFPSPTSIVADAHAAHSQSYALPRVTAIRSTTDTAILEAPIPRRMTKRRNPVMNLLKRSKQH